MGMTGMTWWIIPPAAVLAVPGGRQPVPAPEIRPSLFGTPRSMTPIWPIKRDAVNEVEIAATLDQGSTHRCFTFP